VKFHLNTGIAPASKTTASKQKSYGRYDILRVDILHTTHNFSILRVFRSHNWQL